MKSSRVVVVRPICRKGVSKIVRVINLFKVVGSVDLKLVTLRDLPLIIYLIKRFGLFSRIAICTEILHSRPRVLIYLSQYLCKMTKKFMHAYMNALIIL